MLTLTADRQARLNADSILEHCRTDYRRIRVIAGAAQSFSDLCRILQDSPLPKMRQEAMIAAYEAKRKDVGLPKLSDRDWGEFRQRDLGLAGHPDLYELRARMVAKYHGRTADKIPGVVKRIVGGALDGSLDAILEGAAEILEGRATVEAARGAQGVLASGAYLEEIVRQWAGANGVSSEQDLAAVERLIASHANQQLGSHPPEPYANLTDDAVSLARQLAAHAGRPGDAALAFYFFRCLQRIAAYTVSGRVQWRAEWLRGRKTDPRAIPGASTDQRVLGSTLKAHIIEEEKGHSGATSAATTYRVAVELKRGTVREREAATILGLTLTRDGRPRK